MPSPEVIEFNKLVAPISEDQPAGGELKEDAALSPLYYQVKDAREAARTAERQLQAAWGEEAEVAGIEPPDWDNVVELATKVLTESSKDLWVSAWLVEGLTRLNGFAGLRDGFRLTRELVEAYWDGIHPRPDEDGVKTTVAQLTGLNGEDAEGALISPIHGVPMTEGRNGPAYSGADYQQALALEQVGDPKTRQQRMERGTPTVEMFQSSVRESTPAFYRTLLDDLDQAIEEFNKLNKVLGEKCGKDDWGYDLAPPSSNIEKALGECRERIQALARDKLAMTGTAPAAEAKEEAGTSAASAQASTAGGAQQRLETREDAFRILLQVADFFRRQEPHSVISYALDQLVRWGRLPLPALMTELIGDNNSLKELFKRVGIDANGAAPPTTPAGSSGEKSGSGW